MDFPYFWNEFYSYSYSYSIHILTLSRLTGNNTFRSCVVPIPQPYPAFIVIAILLPDTYISKLGGDKAEQILYALSSGGIQII